jgi:hypothetical protein
METGKNLRNYSTETGRPENERFREACQANGLLAVHVPFRALYYLAENEKEYIAILVYRFSNRIS